MSFRDDFGSNMRSPGNYSPSSNYGGANATGSKGGLLGSFGGTNNPGLGYQTASQVPPAIAEALARNNKPGYAGGEVMQGPIPPALGPQGVPSPQAPMGFGGILPSALSNFRRNPFSRYQTPQQSPGALSWPPGSMGHGSTWGGGQTSANPWSNAYGGYRPGRAMGAGQQGTTNWKGSTTTISPNGRVTKDQSRVPQSNSTYNRMGNDFRSNNFSPASYPGGDGVTGNDIGGYWKR